MTTTCVPNVNVVIYIMYIVYVNITFSKSLQNVAIIFYTHIYISLLLPKKITSDLILPTNLLAWLLRAFPFLCSGLTHTAVMQKRTICLMMSVKL